MIPYVLLLLWLAILLKWADVFVDAASGISKKLWMSQLLIGLTIVAMWTSAPELFVSISAALHWHTDLALGNIIGSNITNLLLIGWIGALCWSVRLDRSLLQSFYISLLMAALLRATSFEWVSWSQWIGIIGWFILAITRSIYLIYTIYYKKKDHDDVSSTTSAHSRRYLLCMTILWILWLCYGSHLVTQNALAIGTMIWASERIMGLVVVAIWTSLPELVTTIVAVRKWSCNLWIGNIIGSNIFNIWLIGWLTAIIHPIAFSWPSNNDIVFLILTTLVFIISMHISQRHNITRIQGWILIIVYFLCTIYTIFKS